MQNQFHKQWFVIFQRARWTALVQGNSIEYKDLYIYILTRQQQLTMAKHEGVMHYAGIQEYLNSLSDKQRCFIDWTEFSTTNPIGELAYDFYKFILGITTLSDYPDFIAPQVSGRNEIHHRKQLQSQSQAVSEKFAAVMDKNIPGNIISKIKVRDGYTAPIARRHGYDYDIHNKIQRAFDSANTSFAQCSASQTAFNVQPCSLDLPSTKVESKTTTTTEPPQATFPSRFGGEFYCNH